MWINIPEELQEIKPPELDEAVDLSGGEKVQVTKEVGTVLTENYDSITTNDE